MKIPIIKRKIEDSDYRYFNILASIVLSFFISILCSFGMRHAIQYLAKDQIITENCDILEFKKGRYRRGGDYYKAKILFKGSEEWVNLDKGFLIN